MDRIQKLEDDIKRLRRQIMIHEGELRALEREINKEQHAIKKIKQGEYVSSDEDDDYIPPVVDVRPPVVPVTTAAAAPATTLAQAVEQERRRRVAQIEKLKHDKKADQEDFIRFLHEYADNIAQYVRSYVPNPHYKNHPLTITETPSGTPLVSAQDRAHWGIMTGIKGRSRLTPPYKSLFVMSYKEVFLSSKHLPLESRELWYEDPRDASDVLRYIIEEYEESKQH
jgi:hypothetical protein